MAALLLALLVQTEVPKSWALVCPFTILHVPNTLSNPFLLAGPSTKVSCGSGHTFLPSPLAFLICWSFLTTTLLLAAPPLLPSSRSLFCCPPLGSDLVSCMSAFPGNGEQCPHPGESESAHVLSGSWIGIRRRVANFPRMMSACQTPRSRPPHEAPEGARWPAL